MLRTWFNANFFKQKHAKNGVIETKNDVFMRKTGDVFSGIFVW